MSCGPGGAGRWHDRRRAAMSGRDEHRMSAVRSDMPPTRSVSRPWIDQLITTQHRRMSLGDQSRRAGTRVALLRGPILPPGVLRIRCVFGLS